MQHYQEDTGCGVDSEGSDESYIDMQEYEYISSEKKQKRSQKKQTLPPKPPKKPAYKNKEKTAPGVISLHASLPRKKFSAFHQNTNASGPRYDIDMAYDQPRNTVYKMKTLKPAVSHEYEQIPEVPIHPVAQTNSFDLLSEKYIVSSDEMMLGEFVNKYKNDFPVQIRVSKGYYGTTDKWCISEGDYFTIHFVKQTKVVGAVDSTFGNYSIPINSSAQFGVVPTSSREAAGGNNFYTVGNLLAQQTLPLAIKATQTWNESKAEKSVSNGEIFIIQGSKGRIKRTLKCVNAINGKQKTLSSKCAGSFTTNPYEIRLYLPEVIKNFSLPNTFAMFINSQSTSSVQYVKLTHCSIETSLIATQLDSLESSPLTEIPIDLDIGIELVRPKFKAEEEARIYELTDHLFSTFDHKALQTIPSNIASLQADPVKAEALLTCHRGHERVGVEIQQPPRYNIRQSHPSQATQSGPQKQYSETGSATELKLQKIESMLTSVMQQVEELKYQLKEVVNIQENLQQRCNSFGDELDLLKVSHLPPKPASFHMEKNPEEVKQYNKSQLQALKIGQVMKLLKGLQLQQYQPVFHTKNITGDRLAQMTAKDLVHIGIPTERQAMLLNVINGTISVNSVMAD